MLAYRRRRQAFGAAGFGQPVRDILRRMARSEFELAASTIGISAEQLRRDFEQGRSIAEVAKAEGVAVESVIKAITTDMSSRIDQEKADGRVSMDLVAQAKARLTFWVPRFVSGHTGEFRRRMS